MAGQLRNSEAAGEFPPQARPTGRRDFLKWTGASALAAMVAACEDATRTIVEVTPPDTVEVTPPPPVFPSVTLDFEDDAGVLNYAYLLEQLEAAFYGAVVAGAGFQTAFNASERVVLEDLLRHQVAHREFLRMALGASAITQIATDFSGVNLSSRLSVLQAAQVLEELGVAGYNGAAPYLTGMESLASVAKIVSVEARHAAAVRDLIAPTGFAPTTLDPPLEPDAVLAALDPYISNPIVLINVPT